MTTENAGNSPENVLNEALGCNLAESDVTVCFASLNKKDAFPRFQALQTTNKLQEWFRRIVQERLGELRGDTSLRLRSYAVGSKPDKHEIEYLRLSEHDNLEDHVAALSSLADLLPFVNEKSFVRGLRFYALVMQLQDGREIYSFRWYSPKKKLDRSGSFIARWNQDRYDLIEEDVLLFDEQIDCFVYGNYVFILNKDKFERIFRFYELVEQRADEALASIKAQVYIRNFERFSEDCKRHTTKLAKLADIATKPYLARLDLEDIKKVISRNPHLAGVIGEEGGREVLTYEPSDHWSLLHLLNDDYLESLMTGQNYEVNSKRVSGS